MGSGRVVAVTGGSRGIGRAVTAAFAATGDRVAAIGRDPDALAAVAATVEGDIGTHVCDVTDEDAVTALFDRLGRVDVLVNNAGMARSAPAEGTTLADWEQHLAVNATGAFLCTRAVLRGMRARDRGRIVNIASVAGLVGSRYTVAYTASKHAMVGLTRAIAAEVAGSGVTVNAVCPAYVDTHMTAGTIERIVGTTGRDAGEARAALERDAPLGRLLAPDEVAAAVVFLAADMSAAINGQTVVLDGGGIQR